MLEFPTIKTDFLFAKSYDFNQTTHARLQHHAFFCGMTKADGGKSAYACFGMQIISLFSLITFKIAVYEADLECSNE